GASLTPKEKRLSAMADFDKRLGKNGAAFGRCIDAAIGVAEAAQARHPKFVLTPGEIKALATALFIEQNRGSRVQDVDCFPTKPFQMIEVPAPPDRAESPPPRTGSPLD